MDPAKLKVVDLRNELSSRGLDTKGNKAVLVKRLKDALESELNKKLPDTSIADTSTEDLDVSLSITADTGESEVAIDPPPSESPDKPKAENKTNVKTPEKTEPVEKIISSESPKEISTATENVKSPEKEVKSQENDLKSPVPVDKSPEKKTISASTEKVETVVEDQSASSDQQEKPNVEAEISDVATKDESAKVTPNDQEVQNDNALENNEEPEKMETNEQESTIANNDENKEASESDQKIDKRKRESDSPDRTQKKRARSPRNVKEDEPDIDNSKVLLSWFDSDLNLQINKDTFLSAKPFTEAAFGYIWAGARATYGIQSGKVCYEVKITDEIKWVDDFCASRYQDRKNRDSNRRDSYRKDSQSETKGTEETKSEESSTEAVKIDAVEQGTGMEAVESGTETVDSENKTENSVETAEKDRLEPAKNTEAVPKEEQDNIEHVAKMETDGGEETSEIKNDETETDNKNVEVKSEPVIEKKEPIPTHFFRVGWSLNKKSLQLGEDQNSYGYDSSGKFASNGEFTDYAIKFGNGDVIGAYLEINDNDVIITFTVNGEAQPEATRIPKSDLPENFVLFPHILTRNYAFEVNFGDKEEPWFPAPSEFSSFTYLSKAEEKIPGPIRPENRSDCEVLLMCGLPASGKTHWVKEHVASNIDKDYTILGKVSLLERMTVSGESLQSRFIGKWHIFLDRMQKALNKLIVMAAYRRRNYIIDQTNVFPSAQRRKLRPYEGFKRRAIIVVVADEEQARRQSLQEAQEGKGVPESTILEMKAAMLLPEKSDFLEEVSYVEAEESEAKEIVKKYNVAGREAGYSSEKRYPHDNKRFDQRGRGFRGGWNNQYQRFDSRGRWNNQRSRGGGGWNRDRYDSRDYRGGNRPYGDRDGYHDSYRYRSHPYNQHGGGRGGRGQGGWGNGGGAGGWGQQGGGYRNQNWGGNSQWKNAGNSGGQGYGSYWNSYGHGPNYQQNWGQQ